MKKIDTLFHSTKELEKLISIIQNGFYPSYSDEIITGRKIKILMVSFSNVALLESKSYVNYGNYSIGLKRDWGIENKLHPVSYTYDDSFFNNIIDDTFKLSACGLLLHAIHDTERIIKAEELKIFNDILKHPGVDRELLFMLEVIFKKIFDNNASVFPYLKNYKVLDKDGHSFVAYNDREWRFLPKIEQNDLVIFETNKDASSYNPKFKAINDKPKPHFTEIKLDFGINDLTNLIVEKKSEIEMIYEVLFDKFGKESVDKLVRSGELSINSLDNLNNNY